MPACCFDTFADACVIAFCEVTLEQIYTLDNKQLGNCNMLKSGQLLKLKVVLSLEAVESLARGAVHLPPADNFHYFHSVRSFCLLSNTGVTISMTK